jgi:hypothetical protein
MTAAPRATTGADGILGPLNPFGIDPPSPDAKEDEIPGYVKRFGAYVSGVIYYQQRLES